MSTPGYAIAWTTPARRALARLPEKIATAAVEFIYGSMAASPHRVGKPLKLGLVGLHCARRGDYRVIYRIDDHEHRIDVVAIEHRSDAYRSRRRSPITRLSRVSRLAGSGASRSSGYVPPAEARGLRVARRRGAPVDELSAPAALTTTESAVVAEQVIFQRHGPPT